MRITFVAQNVNAGKGSDGGGSGRSLDLIASGLAEQGHDITVLTVNSQRNTATGELPYTLNEIDDVSPRRPEFYDRYIPKVLRAHESETDMYHLFEPHFLPGAGKYAQTTTPPIAGRLNNYGLFCFNQGEWQKGCHANCNVVKRFQHYNGGIQKNIALAPFMKYADRRLNRINEVDLLVPVTPPVGDIYREVGVTEPTIRPIPNMYDANFQEQTGEQPEEMTTEGVDFLFAGRLIPLKGIKTLLKAAREVSTDAHIHIVGDGHEKEGLVDYASEHGLENVHFHGYVHHYEMSGYYRHADIYVHPVLSPDTCPRSVLEAIVSGMGLLVSDIGGPPWMAGEACLTVPPGNPNELAEQIERLCEEPALRERLAEKTDAELAKFEPSRIVDIYESSHRSLLNG